MIVEQLSIQLSSISVRPLTTADTISLSFVKDEFNKVFISGSVTLSSIDFDYVLNERVNNGVTHIEVISGSITGLMETNGDINYNARVCTLKVSSPERFDSIINLEFVPTNNALEFEYNSYNVKEYASPAYVPDGYDECTDLPLEWNFYTEFDSAQEISPGVWLGDQNNIRIDDGVAGQTYISIQSNNIGHDPLDELNPTTSPVWWYLPTGSEIPRTLGQVRSQYKFDDAAEYNEYNKYWFLPGCIGSVLTGTVAGVNIKTAIQEQLEDNGFTLDDDWLEYPKSINSLYEDSLWLASTEIKEKTTLFELISIIKEAFNCDYVVTDDVLKFIWKGDRYNTWNSSLPSEHDLRDIDIYEWKDSSTKNVKRHVLKFTESSLSTHKNSIIEYDNEFTDEADVSPNFDVDFVYSFNEGDTPCLITSDSSGDLISSNPYLVPSLLHETFYFVDREFKEGTFDGNSVTLQLGFFEEASRELPGNYIFDNWDLEYPILINNLTDDSGDQFAVCDEVKYSVENNNYTLKLRTRN